MMLISRPQQGITPYASLKTSKLRKSVLKQFNAPALTRRSCHSIRPSAQKDDGRDPSNSTPRLKEVDRLLKEFGVDKSTAKKVLSVWKKAGATDPESLRRLLKKRGADRSMALAFNFAVNAATAAVAWTAGIQIATSRSLGSFTIAGEYVTYVLAMYLTISATLDVFTLVSVGLTTRKYTERSAAILEAISTLAGPEIGLEVVDKARRAVATVQVLRALDQILQGLKEDARTADPEDFFRDLGAYLVLTRAGAKGFDPGSLGIAPIDAADIAAEFAIADSDDDGKVDALEFRKVAARLAPSLTQEEVEAAIQILDTNKDGVVDFKEFVSWWVSNEKAPLNASD